MTPEEEVAEAARRAEAEEQRVEARKVQLAKRVQHYEAHRDALRFCDLLIVQGLQKFGGSLPEEITPRDPQLLLWGLWLRDTKRAIDAAPEGEQIELLPFPPVPSWFDWNPGIRELAQKIGITPPA